MGEDREVVGEGSAWVVWFATILGYTSVKCGSHKSVAGNVGATMCGKNLRKIRSMDDGL
jgi:hypothetical protein